MERGTPTRQTSLIIDPPNGRLPPLTAEEQKLRKEARGGKGFPGEWRGQADSYDDLNIYYRCITRGVLGSIIPVIYNNGNEILQAPGLVIIRNEMIHETRIIPLDGRPHLSPEIRQYMGDSRGHWEGNTLVIETTNFTDKDAIGSNGAGYPGDPGHHSADLKLTERLTRVDANTLNYQATIDDPKTWTQPWTILIPLKRNDNYQLLEYACHEGNIAMGDILSGARADELEENEIGIECRYKIAGQEGVRMRTRLAMVAAGAGLLLAVAPAWAHHAFQAEFDSGKPVHLTGTVTDMEWINPHSWIHIDVKNPDGTVTNWMVECGSPNIMLRRGFTKRSLEVGTELTIQGYQAKNGHEQSQRQQRDLQGRQEVVCRRIEPGHSARSKVRARRLRMRYRVFALLGNGGALVLAGDGPSAGGQSSFVIG